MSFSTDVKAELNKLFTIDKKTISIYRVTKDDIDAMNEKKRRAFLRECFFSTGSVSDPMKSYHFEIVCDSKDQAEALMFLLREYELDAKITDRKGHLVVYLKEGEQIADTLALMGARGAVMTFQNARVEREVRGSINRRVNCETANIKKTVSASVRQIEDIRLIEEKRGLSSLPQNLRDIAMIRLEYPDTSLADLGGLLDPPVGKSGVNHRLRRIGDIAESIRRNSNS